MLAFLGCAKAAKDHLEGAKNALFEKKPEEALREYRLALDTLEKDASPEAQVLRARALRGAADTYYLELRDVRKAAEVYRELISQCPEAPETLEGRIYLADILRNYYRDLRGGIRELSAAVARNPPQGAELSYQVAKLYFELGDYQQCDLEVQNLTKKYETSPFVDDALLLRAQALAMVEGRRPEAMRAFQELIDRFPDSALRPHALFELGRLRAELGEGEKAIELWVHALEHHPDPQVVQTVIARTRARLRATVPDAVGQRAKAFDRPPAQARARVAPKTSAEAVGGTAAEAEQERSMNPHGAEAKKAEAEPVPQDAPTEATAPAP